MKQNILILVLVGLLAACVTINIYFPAAAAQEVADEIIDDVWQIEDDGENASVPAEPTEESSTEESTESK